jgi:hypothetical protein
LSRANSAQRRTEDYEATEPAGDVIRLPVPARAPFPPAAAMAVPTLVTARVQEVEGDRVRLAVGSKVVLATRDPALHPTVLASAAARGERVLAERADDGTWTVVGALRTQPTPGIDVADEYTIEAGRVTIRGKHEVSLVAEAAGLAVRAAGEIESYAERIVSRAEGLHKIVGRILKLN